MFQDVPNSSKEEDGNNVSSSSSPSALYKYDFVINNYTEVEVCQIKQTISRLAKKGIIGFEVGESGTPHLQGYISLHKKLRITTLAKEPGFSRASMRAIRNDLATIEYCKKDGNFWTHGFPRPINIISNLYPWQKDAEALLTGSSVDDRIVHWWYDRDGNIGKSAFAKYMVVKHKALYCCSGKYADLINLVFNCDMDNCSCIIFDIPRNQGNKVSYSAIESIKNGLICNTKFETGTKVFNSPHVLVLSNMPPDIDALSIDRWKIKNLGSEESVEDNNYTEDDIDLELLEYKELEREFFENQ